MPISTRSLQLATPAGRTSWATRYSKAYLLDPVGPAGRGWSPASIGRLCQPEQIEALCLSTQRQSSDPKNEEPPLIFDFRSEDWAEDRHRLRGGPKNAIGYMVSSKNVVIFIMGEPSFLMEEAKHPS